MSVNTSCESIYHEQSWVEFSDGHWNHENSKNRIWTLLKTFTLFIFKDKKKKSLILFFLYIGPISHLFFGKLLMDLINLLSRQKTIHLLMPKTQTSIFYANNDIFMLSYTKRYFLVLAICNFFKKKWIFLAFFICSFFYISCSNIIIIIK